MKKKCKYRLKLGLMFMLKFFEYLGALIGYCTTNEYIVTGFFAVVTLLVGFIAFTSFPAIKRRLSR
jgi:hypothetical protein